MTKKENQDLRHVAIIMDGNGRWAQAKGWSRSMGHRAGTETLKRIVEACPQLGIQYLTVYAFSTENWKRPAKEISALMVLMAEYIDRELDRLKEMGVRINVLGELDPLNATLKKKIVNAVAATADNQSLHLSLALNYGGRQELLRAAQKLSQLALQGQDPSQWTEADMQACLYTAALPDPELVIRTGGEFRLSNFLLWQLAYAEFWSTPVFWPDFTPELLNQAIEEYRGRQRRFGGI
jgi:undecaprenyl diphosphate synthase